MNKIKLVQIGFRERTYNKGPDCSFTYASREDEGFQKSWALDNPQPLGLIENMKKHRKIIPQLELQD